MKPMPAVLFYPDYFRTKEKKYFYDLLKHLGDLTDIKDEDYIDWNRDQEFTPEIGLGEMCRSQLRFGQHHFQRS